MNKESFEKLDDYQLREDFKQFVPESLESLNEKGDDGIFGKIIDRGLSFVPRAARFSKAKKEMAKQLKGWTRAAQKYVKTAAKSIDKKVRKVKEEYNKTIENDIKPLLKEGKYEEAESLLKNKLDYIEKFKKDELELLDKNIKELLEPYNQAVEERIKDPGFVLNVELSPKGKGALRAKWKNLVNNQQLKINDYKLDLLSSTSWTDLDKIISQIKGFIEKRKRQLTGGKDINVEIKIIDIEEKGSDTYAINAKVVREGGLLKISEKGFLVSENVYDLEDAYKVLDNPNVTKYTERGKYELSTGAIRTSIKATLDSFIRPYMIPMGDSAPILGAIVNIEDKIRELARAKNPDIADSGGRGDIEDPVDFTADAKKKAEEKRKREMEKALNIEKEEKEENNESFTSLSNYKKLNESYAFYCNTCGERAEHEEIEENPNLRCSNCGDSDWSDENEYEANNEY